jgi:hypothetical protein
METNEMFKGAIEHGYLIVVPGREAISLSLRWASYCQYNRLIRIEVRPHQKYAVIEIDLEPALKRFSRGASEKVMTYLRSVLGCTNFEVVNSSRSMSVRRVPVAKATFIAAELSKIVAKNSEEPNGWGAY